jgi:hypothetical protein
MPPPRNSAAQPVAPPRWVELLMSVYYRTTWEQAGLKPPEELQLDAERRWQANLPPLDVALDELAVGASIRGRRLDQLVARLALAQLARATPVRPSAVPQGTAGMRELAHALLVRSPKSRQDARRSVSTQVARLVDELLAYSPDGDARFSHAFAHSALSFSDLFATKENWTARSSRGGIADATSSILVDRPLASLAPLITPLAWRRFPFLWKHAYFTRLVPTDLEQPPEELDAGPLCFEEVLFGWNAFPIARYRNLLSVTQRASEIELSFDYTERLCLTTNFLGGPAQPGGLDIDEGSVSATQTTGPTRPWTRLTGRKRFRGSLPAPPFDDDFAQIVSVTTPLLVEATILIGAQTETEEVSVA